MARTLRLFPVMLLGCLGLLLTWTAATVSLDPSAQAVVALGSLAVFLIGNRAQGRGMTLFLTMLSSIVSLRYIVWRFTETLDFTTVAQGALGFGLALAEFYAIVVLALGYIQTAWPLERQPVPLPADPRPVAQRGHLCADVQRGYLDRAADRAGGVADRLAGGQAAGLHP